MMEVHEYNPERRFVIFNDSSKASVDAAMTNPTASKAPMMNQPQDSAQLDAYCGGTREPPRASDQSKPDSARPGLERRRSKQQLPPLATDDPPRGPPEHRRSQSTTIADASRPSYFSPRMSRPSGDQLLFPDVIQTGPGNRDKGWNCSSTFDDTSPGRRLRFELSNESRGSLYHRRTRTNSTSRPLDLGLEAAKASNRLSGGWAGEAYRRRDLSPPSRSLARETPERRQGVAGVTPPLTPRDQSRSSDSPFMKEHAYTGSPKTPIAAQDGNKASGDENGRVRSRSRVRTMPLPQPSQASPSMPRSSATFPLVNDTHRQSRDQQATLPYPDDETSSRNGFGTYNWDASLMKASTGPTAGLTMPEPVPVSPTKIQPSAGARNPTSPAVTPKKTPDSWQLPPFDPNSSRLGTDRPVGSYRRYSETKEQNGSAGLPECPRTAPVAGKMD